MSLKPKKGSIIIVFMTVHNLWCIKKHDLHITKISPKKPILKTHFKFLREHMANANAVPGLWITN